MNDVDTAPTSFTWPAPFSPESADLYSSGEVVIDAYAERVWRHLTDATHWPDWYPNARNVHFLDGSSVLRDDARFAWVAGGLDVECQVVEFKPNRRLAWLGSVPGEAPVFCHFWRLIADGPHTRVVTSEVAMGDLPRRIAAQDKHALGRGNDMWLAVLKWISETTQRAI